MGKSKDVFISLFFLITIHWIIWQVSKGKDTGKEWMDYVQLEDLDYADILALLSDNLENLKIKTKWVGRTAKMDYPKNKCKEDQNTQDSCHKERKVGLQWGEVR